MAVGEFMAEMKVLTKEDEYRSSSEFRPESGEQHVQVALVRGIEGSPVDDDQVLAVCLEGYIQLLDFVEVRGGGQSDGFEGLLDIVL